MSAPRRPVWFDRVTTGLVLLVLLFLVVSLGVSTYRMLFPRPPAPSYVCVYVSTKDITAVSGGTACTQGG